MRVKSVPGRASSARRQMSATVSPTSVGVPAAHGELCRIERGDLGPIDAEVVGFRGLSTLLMPHGDLTGIAPLQVVVALGRTFAIPVGNELLGRLVNGFGQPMDGGPPLLSQTLREVRRPAPDPLSRPSIDDPLQTGAYGRNI